MMKSKYNQGFNDGYNGRPEMLNDKLYRAGFNDGLYLVLSRGYSKKKAIAWDVIAVVLGGLLVLLMCFL
jgi:hypothetical protein